MHIPRSQKKTRPGYPPVVLIMILAGAMLAAGCTSQTAAGTGSPATQVPVLKIADILKDPATYNGTTVVIQGKITNECGSGCWFMIDDGTGTLYVDLAPNNFAIPQITGTTVVVHGNISITRGDPTLVATNIVTDSRTYP
jgi:uncharacterized protein YdeI (BOF family)